MRRAVHALVLHSQCWHAVEWRRGAWYERRLTPTARGDQVRRWAAFTEPAVLLERGPPHPMPPAWPPQLRSRARRERRQQCQRVQEEWKQAHAAPALVPPLLRGLGHASGGIEHQARSYHQPADVLVVDEVSDIFTPATPPFAALIEFAAETELDHGATTVMVWRRPPRTAGPSPDEYYHPGGWDARLREEARRRQELRQRYPAAGERARVKEARRALRQRAMDADATPAQLAAAAARGVAQEQPALIEL
jgi:hypothetical protein